MAARPIGLSRDLAKQRVMRADVDGVDLAVWRDKDGGLHAWNNRCPHRGMRLSHGFVRGDRLACLYHGWQYGKTGRCAYIPAHPDLEPPETIHTQVYSATEDSGVIWVSVDGESAGAPIPDTAPLRSLEFACSESAARQALADTPKPKGGTASAVMNPISEALTLVHVLVPQATTLAERKALSRWAETARSRAEEADAGRRGEPRPTPAGPA